MINKAIEKLNDEKINFKGGRHAKAMVDDVHRVLVSFCEQEEEFAQAIVQSDKTLSDCLTAVANGVTGSISDLDAYKKAVRFYFDGADIECTMKIDLIGIGTAADTPPIEMSSSAEQPKKTVFEMSLDDLL